MLIRYRTEVKNNIKEYAKDTQNDAVNIKTDAATKADANSKNKSDNANKKDDSASNTKTSSEETGSINTQQDTGIINKIMSFFKS